MRPKFATRTFLACALSGVAWLSSFQTLRAEGPRGPRPGQMAPDFELKDLDGRLYKLSQFKGNVIFLNFWATWCPPCVEEFPSMEALNQRLKAKPFMMIAVSIDESASTIRSFLKSQKKSPSFLILHDPAHRIVSDLYGTYQFPETYWIDPEGRVVKKFEGAYPWLRESFLTSLEGILPKPSILSQSASPANSGLLKAPEKPLKTQKTK